MSGKSDSWAGKIVALPTDVLHRILHFLALDGASFAWQYLAYLTCNNGDLRTLAKQMQRPLVLRVKIDPDLKDTRFFLPFYQAKIVHIRIDWGDGETDIIDGKSKAPSALHTYFSAGQFTVRVMPYGPGIDGVWLDHLGWTDSLVGSGDAWKNLSSFDSLGSLGIRSFDHLFYYSTHNIPLCTLDTSGIETMRSAFHGATSFNQSIERWNVSSVKDMKAMFFHATSFNQPLGRWNVSNVISMEAMFCNAKAFNQPLETWNIGNVQNISFMFQVAVQFKRFQSQHDATCVFNLARRFNQSLEAWDVSQVIHMDVMFGFAERFNHPIGNWDVSV
jgi:surface protein